MLNKQTLVNFINEKLNEIDSNYKFNIVAEVGETKAGYISGILITNEADTPNIPNYSEVDYSFTVAVLVPSAKTNENYNKIENIVGQFVNSYDATEQIFDDVDMTLNITPGKPDTLNTAFEVGNNVPLYFTIQGLYGNNVTSTKKHWVIDDGSDNLRDVEIPFESEGVYLNKDGKTSKIQGIFNTQTLPTGVTKQYRFVFPYSKAFKQLQQDILSGDFKKIYTLKYYDGVSYTEESPFETKVSIFATGDNGSSRTKTAKFNITFTDVDDGNTSIKYWLALIDFPFDNEAEDTRWFDTRAEQQTYFAGKVSSGCAYVQIKAPNINSLNITSQVYENTGNYTLLNVMNKNYAIIKIEKTVGATTTTDYLYYYITNCQVGANNQFMFDLRMDTIQTYVIGKGITFGDSYIEKSNLNRWIDNEDGTVSFDGTVDSKLFEREDIQNVAKRMVKRTSVGLYPDTELGNWLAEHVLCWMYIYVSDSHEYKFRGFNTYKTIDGGGTDVTYPNSIPSVKYLTTTKAPSEGHDNRTAIPSNISILCYPILDNNSEIRLQQGDVIFDHTMHNGSSISSFTVSELNSLQKTSDKKNYLYKLSNSGDLNNEDGTTLSVVAGDYVVLKFGNVYWYWVKATGMNTTTNKPIFDPVVLGNYELWINQYKSILDYFTGNNVDTSNQNETTYNNGYANIYTVKVSSYPPSLNYNAVSNNYEIINDGGEHRLYIKKCVRQTASNSDGIICPLLPQDLGEFEDDDTTNVKCVDLAQFIINNQILKQGYLCFGVVYSLNQDVEVDYTVDRQLTFKLTDIINANKNSNFNPKLLSADYYALKISDQTENGFDYDLQKLNKTDLKIKYTESLTPDMNKVYARISNTDGIYIEDTEKNLTGFVTTNDNSITMPTSAYQQMLANNKNFFLQNSTNRDYGLLQGSLSSGMAVAGGLAAQNPLAVIGGLIGATNIGLNYNKQKINENLTVDNLKNAPDSVINAKGNISFEAAISDLGLVVEEWDILPHEKAVANDYMVKYGFNTNVIGNVYDYMNGTGVNARAKFNYIKAQLSTMTGMAINNITRADIRSRFANGIRFWNSDTISYDKENYEKWLDNVTRVPVVCEHTGEIYDTVYKTLVQAGIETTTDTFSSYKNQTIEFTSAGKVVHITSADTDGTITDYRETWDGLTYKTIVSYENATYLNLTYYLAIPL